MFNSNRALWLTLGILVALVLFVNAYPLYVIRPFRAQGATEFAIAMTVKIWGTMVGVGAAAVGAFCAVRLWGNNTRWIHKGGGVGFAALLAALAGAAHFNVYEMMFHAVENPEFIALTESKLEAGDMVLAVNIGGQSHAYPIRMMGYHHIVNDRIGREPVVSTY